MSVTAHPHARVREEEGGIGSADSLTTLVVDWYFHSRWVTCRGETVGTSESQRSIFSAWVSNTTRGVSTVATWGPIWAGGSPQPGILEESEGFLARLFPEIVAIRPDQLDEILGDEGA